MKAMHILGGGGGRQGKHSVIYLYPPPPPTPIESRGTYMFVPHHLNPPISDIGYW